MSYIGQQLPADVFSGFTTDSFTGDGSATTFTLSKAPFSENGLIVVINNVIQKPTTNFTVSGTTLTIVGTAVADGDVIYATHISGVIPSTLASKVDVNGVSDAVILDADADTTISADTDDQIDFKAGGTDIMSLTATTATFNDGVSINVTDNSDALTLTSTDADASEGPVIIFDRNSSSSADADFIGALSYRGRNDADQGVDYCKILAQIDDASDGSEDAQLFIKSMTNGTSNNRVAVYGSSTVFNDDGANIDLRIEGQNGAFTNANRFVFLDASAGRFSINSPDGSPTVNFHCYNPHSDGYIAKFENTHTNAGQYGLNIKFAAAPDNNSQHAFVFEDTSATRFKIWADGDAQNHDGHFSTLSDERIKESITDANSQWDDIKALKFKNFKLKDDVRQYGADEANKHLGLIAQEVELVSPNLVKSYPPSKEHILSDSVFGTLYEEGDDIPEDKKVGDIKTEGENVKGLKQSIVFMKGMKALQEAMTRIEELETKVKSLEDA